MLLLQLQRYELITLHFRAHLSVNTLLVESVWRFVEFFDLILAMKTTFIILVFFSYHLDGFGFTFLRDNLINNGITT